jgi:hypothetical protein
MVDLDRVDFVLSGAKSFEQAVHGGAGDGGREVEIGAVKHGIKLLSKIKEKGGKENLSRRSRQSFV